jgi:hypothetical protein
LAYLKKEAKRIKSNNPIIFITIPINPKILVIKHKFKLAQRKGISQVIVANEEDLSDLNKEGSNSKGLLVKDNNIILLLLQLVVSINLI